MLLLSFVSFKYKFLKLCFIYELTLYFCNSNSTKENTVDRKRGSTLKVWMYCTYCSHSGLLINKSRDGSLASCSVLDSCEVHYQEKRKIRPQVMHDFSQMELRFPFQVTSKTELRTKCCDWSFHDLFLSVPFSNCTFESMSWTANVCSVLLKGNANLCSSLFIYFYKLIPVSTEIITSF